MDTTLTIERLDADAARAALPDLVRLLQDAVDNGASVGYLPPLSAAEAEGYWQSVVDALQTTHRILLAARQADPANVTANTIVGSVQLGLETRPNGRHRAEVIKLLVHTSQRRRGIARRLMTQIEEEARRAGRTTLVLDTLDGHPAEQLYRALGYQRAGAIPEFAAIADGSLQPTIVMYKLLAKNGVR